MSKKIENIKYMKDKLLSWLLSTGLDYQRAELYLTCLSHGEANAKELAKDMKMGRTAVYDNLRALEERGLIKTVLHGKRKIFVPLHPKELYKKVESQKQQLKDLLPDFLSQFAIIDKQPFVQIFQGSYAAREVYEDILTTTKKEYLYFSPPQLTLQTVDKFYIKKWIARRVKKGLHSRSLRVKSKIISDEPIFNEQNIYLRQVRFLPEYMDLKASVYIYENKIGLISTSRENAAFIIQSSDLAFSLKQLFEFLWGISLRT